MRKERTGWQKFLLAMLLALMLAIGQTPIAAIAGGEPGQAGDAAADTLDGSSYAVRTAASPGGTVVPPLGVVPIPNKLAGTPRSFLKAQGDDDPQIFVYYSSEGIPALTELAHPGDQISIERFDSFAQFDLPYHKRFSGWSVSAGDVRFISAKQVAEGYKLTVPYIGGTTAPTLTLSAVFEDDTYSVAFDTHGGTPAVESQTVFSGDKATKPQTDPAKGEWGFGGWFRDAQGTQAYDFGASVRRDTVLHARWDGTLSVEAYDKSWDEPGGGSFDYETFEGTGEGLATYVASAIPEGSTVKLTAHPAEGYRFVGWASADDPDDIVSTDLQYEFAMAAPSVKLQAVFEEKPVTLTVHWSSIDGVDLTDPIVFDGIEKGTDLAKALGDHDVAYDDAQLFEKDGYTAYGNRWSSRPISEFSSIGELDAACLGGETKINSDMDVYFAMGKAIRSVTVKVAPPAIGTETYTSDGKEAWLAQVNPPQLSVPENAGYSLDTASGDLPGIWCTEDGNDPFQGKFEEGKAYFFAAALVSDYGYSFAPDCEGIIDGGTAVDRLRGVTTFIVQGKVELPTSPAPASASEPPSAPKLPDISHTGDGFALVACILGIAAAVAAGLLVYAVHRRRNR